MEVAEFEAQSQWAAGVAPSDMAAATDGRSSLRPVDAEVAMDALLDPKPDFNPHDEVFCFENFDQKGMRVLPKEEFRRVAGQDELMMDDLGWGAAEQAPPVREVWTKVKPEDYLARAPEPSTAEAAIRPRTRPSRAPRPSRRSRWRR